MKTAREIYPHAFDKGSYDSPCSYDPLIKSIGNVLIQIDDDDYQGDTRVLYQEGDRIGYLNFGWGSCSGCDSLQTCRSYEEVQNLLNNLANDVKWFDSKEAAKDYFEKTPWDLKYSWKYSGQREFLKKVAEFLGATITVEDFA